MSQGRFIGGLSTQRFCVNTAIQGDKKDSEWLVAWLTETGIKRWPTVSELESPNLPWFQVEEGIKNLQEIGMLEWICYFRSSTHS